MPDRFLTTGTPLTDTFSFRKERPCGFEQPSQPPLAKSVPCPYRFQCDSTAGGLPLRQVFGRSIRVTLTESSSSIVVRSEHQYSRDERHRLCLRKHVHELESEPIRSWKISDGVVSAVKRHLDYEVDRGRLSLTADQTVGIVKYLQGWIGDGEGYVDEARFVEVIEGLGTRLSELEVPEPERGGVIRVVRRHATATLACHPIGPGEKLGKYLGFVDVRTNSILAPLALGLLVPPRELRHDPDVTIATGEYGRIFGAHGFTSTVYSMHDPEAGGARCAQACVIMALAMLADRGAKVLGSYDLTCLGKDPIDPRSEDGACLERREGYAGAFAVDGLKADEIVKLLRRHECHTSGDGWRARFTLSNFRECKRLIEAYVSARCPVIMLVDTAEWWERKQSVGHAVLIVGVRRGRGEATTRPPLSEVTELIVHDPGDKPFVVRPIRDCLRASWAFAKSPEHKEKFHLIFVAEARIKQHASHCLRAIEDHDHDRWEKYCAVPDSGSTADYRIALLHRSEVVKRFTDPSHDIAWIYSRSNVPENQLESDERAMTRRFEKLRGVAGVLSSGLYWCIAGYEGQELEVLWLFNAEREPSDEWDYRVNFGG
ncbi:MAG TPA: hypothetical protein VMY37_15225 [Thermoguttaceae bacterium]|nr:hypothetical protein [Thermoguttaceae bacterium]